MNTKEKIEELERQAEEAERQASRTDPRLAEAARLGFEVPDPAKLREEAERARRKAAILREHELAQTRIAEAERLAGTPGYTVNQSDLDSAKAQLAQNETLIEAITSDKLAPFILMSSGEYPSIAEGSYTELIERLGKHGDIRIDIAGAVKAGVPDKLLRQAGIKQLTIVKTRKSLAAEKTHRESDVIAGKMIDERNAEIQSAFLKKNTLLPDGVYMANKELTRLKKDNPELYQILKTLGAGEADRYVTRQKAALETIRKQAPESISENGIFLGIALSNGVSESVLKQAGFSQEQIDRSRPVSTSARLDEASNTVFGKPYKDLNVFQKAIAAEQAQNIHDFSPDTMPAAVRIGVSMTPVMGTMYFWDEMETGEKTLSVAGDVLFFTAPYIIPRIFSAVKAATTADDLVKVYEKSTQLTVKQLRKIAPNLVTPFKNVSKAQVQYIDDLIKQKQLTTVIDETEGLLNSKALKPGSKQYEAVESLLNKSKAELAAIQNRLPDDVTDLKQSFELWQRASKAETQLDDIVKYTESVVDQATRRSAAAEVAELKSNLSKAQAALNQARRKYPTSPEKWVDLSQDVAEAEAKLKAVQMGDALAMQHQLISVNEMIPILEKSLPQTSKSSPYYAVLEETLKNARRAAAELPGEIDKNVRSLEILWGRGGGIPRGGGFTATLDKNPVLSGLGGVTKSELTELAKRSTLWRAARVFGVTPVSSSPKNLSELELIRMGEAEYPLTINTPSKIRAMNTEGSPVSVQAVSTVPVSQILPDLKTSIISSAQTEPSTSTNIESKTEISIQPEVSPVTQSETQSKTDTKLTEGTKTPTKIKPVPPVGHGKGKGDSKDAEKRKQIIDAGGAVTWPQGKLNDKTVWHVILAPYDKPRHLVVVGEQPEGAVNYPGPGQAYKSITALSGKGPKNPVKVEGGAVDPVISSQNGRPRLSFVHDRSASKRKKSSTQTYPSSFAPDVVVTKRGKRVRRHLSKR